MSARRRRATARVCLTASALAISLAIGLTGAKVAVAGSADPRSAGALYADVVRYASFGDHQTGTPSEAATQSWIKAQFSALGLRTGRDPYRFFAFNPGAVSLRVAGNPVNPVLPYFYSGTTPAGGVSAKLVDAGLGTSAEVSAAKVSGKIAVISVPAVKDSIDPTFANAVTALRGAGARALVAITDGPANLPFEEDVDSRAGIIGLPTVFVGKQSGAGVLSAADAGKSGTVTLTAGVGSGCDTNVWAVLPGQDPRRTIVVATPTSAFDEAASERGSGVAILLGLARHYAALPLSQRPLTMVFAATSGHEVGYLGLPTLMQTHPAWFADADAYVHLGASIGALEEDEIDGHTVTTGGGDASRDLYVSENPLLESIATRAFAGAQPLGSLPPSVEDPGEQAYAYHAGVPMISVSGGSYYFHTTGDVPSTVGPNVLAAMASGFQDAIDEIATEPAGAIRSENSLADSLGAHQTPNSTPGGGSVVNVPADLPEPVASCPGGAWRPPPPASPFVRGGGRGRTPKRRHRRSTKVVARRHHRTRHHRRVAAVRPRRTGTARASVARSATAAGSTGVAVPPAVNPTSPGAALDTPPPVYPWEGAFRSQNVTFASAATGAILFGVLFEPAHVSPAQDGRLPAVVITPGSGPGLQSMYQWSARDLAGHGYLALTVDPQGVGRSQTFGTVPCTASGCPGVPFQQTGNYEDATTSGIDFLLSHADPARTLLNPNEIGAAGHSLSARAVSYLQGVDHRIKAIVAWDNLASNLEGDAGAPSGGGAGGSLIGGEIPGPATPVTPRVPALGEASDGYGADDPTDRSPEQKKTAYEVWRSAGVPAMETVFKGAGHLDWAQTANNSKSDEASLEAFEYYTRAWFDLYLRHDRAATARLLARTVDGEPLAAVLSSQFISAAFLPAERVDCPNLVASCAAAAPNQPVLSALRLTPRRFRDARRGRSVAAADPPRTGTTITYRDSIRAITRFTVERRAGSTLIPLGSFTRAGNSGDNRLHFSGRISGKLLAPGRYTLLAVASNDGAAGKPLTADFEVVGK